MELLKGDVLAVLNSKEAANTVSESSAEDPIRLLRWKLKPIVTAKVKMSRLRQAVASRLKEAGKYCSNADSYNEAMSAVISMRNEFRGF